ncbi:MAG: hypothetical protein OXC26_20650 [Albidovulum sp.]|nr:hypothetical protein [Albidovulum sp.]
MEIDSGSHVVADEEGMARLGIDAKCAIGKHHAQGGLEAVERDDGIRPDTMVRDDLPYNKYLKSKGFAEDSNPWS